MNGNAFDFGQGEVPAHRHINPDGSVGGWVADTATVHPSVWVGPRALVWDTVVAMRDVSVMTPEK